MYVVCTGYGEIAIPRPLDLCYENKLHIFQIVAKYNFSKVEKTALLGRRNSILNYQKCISNRKTIFCMHRSNSFYIKYFACQC